MNGAIAEALEETRKILPGAGRAHQLVPDMEVLVIGDLYLRGDFRFFIH